MEIASTSWLAPVPSVSVVIPVKDDAGLLRRCLEALNAQRIPPVEVIVVDNASRDTTAEVARSHGARVVFEAAPGIPAAAAAGFDAASGEVVARLDADCVPPPDWIERIGRAFAVDPELDALTGSATFASGPAWVRRSLSAAYLGAYLAIVGPALGHVPLFGSNFAVRRSAWSEVRDDVHRHDTLMHDDMDLSMHLGPCRRIRRDRALSVEMSIRAFQGGGVLRIRRGFHTVVAHWPRELPWLRWWRRLRWSLGRGTSARGSRGAQDTAVGGRYPSPSRSAPSSRRLAVFSQRKQPT
jgi:glycosyltransferase involved in cell wall biosynthesis